MLIYRKIQGGLMTVGQIDPASAYDVAGKATVHLDDGIKRALNVGNPDPFPTFAEAAEWLRGVFPGAVFGKQYDAKAGRAVTLEEMTA